MTAQNCRLMAAILAVIALAACERPGWRTPPPEAVAEPSVPPNLEAPTPAVAPTSPEVVSGEDVRVWTDPATGCDYLIFYGFKKGGIIPRLNTDGKPWCSFDAAPAKPEAK